MEYLTGVFSSHEWRDRDVATALQPRGLLKRLLLNTPEGFLIYQEEVKKLLTKLEEEYFNIPFGLFLHYDMHLTLAKISQISQVACKRFKHARDRYEPEPLLSNPFLKNVTLNVPRLAPPRSRLEPIIRKVEAQLGVQSSEEGRMAFTSLADVVQQMMVQDPGSQDMPALPFFTGGMVDFAIGLSWDGTGYGKLGLNTIAARNPWLSASAQMLRIIGLGVCGDNRSGTTALLGPNRAWINEKFLEHGSGTRGDLQPMRSGPLWPRGTVRERFFISTDLAAARHCEHMAGSGLCCCPRDLALRQTPTVYPTKKTLRPFLRQCVSPNRDPRFILSHNPLPGEVVCRPCIAEGCFFAHDPETAVAEYEEMLETEAALAAVQTRAGKAAFSKWRTA